MKHSFAYFASLAGLFFSGCAICKDTTYDVTTQEFFQWTDLGGMVQDDGIIEVPAANCHALCEKVGDRFSHFTEIDNCFLELHPIFEDPTVPSGTTDAWIRAGESSNPVRLPADWPFDEPIIRAICTGEYFEACRH